MTYVILIAMMAMPSLLGLFALRQAVDTQSVPVRIPSHSDTMARK